VRACACVRMLRGQSEVGACLLLRLQRPRLRTQDIKLVQSQLAAASKRHSLNSMLVSGFGRGSDLLAVRSQSAGAEHFKGLGALARTLGESSFPVAVTLDGHVTGAAVGIGAHASTCVVTERTRISLPGVAYGFVPEAFCGYQLARMPRGLGAYLSLTGASLSGGEMIDLGLATHMTESQALWRVEEAMGLQHDPHLGRTLRAIDEACIAPRHMPYSEQHALHFVNEVADTFGRSSLIDIVRALEAGETPWHAQALQLLRAASPLAAHLTFAALQEASAAACWTHSLDVEVGVCAAALQSRDAAAGLAELEDLKTELDGEVSAGAAAAAVVDDDELGDDGMDEEGLAEGGWEHGSIEELPEEMVRAYMA